MFEDIIGTKPVFFYKLEKNGGIIENAIIDASKYKETGEGYVTCPGLTITNSDCFMLLLTYTKDTHLTHRMSRILVTQLPDGRIKFENV